MIWSRNRFEEEGRHLCSCLKQLSNNADNVTDIGLLRWEIMDTDFHHVYLRHDPITTVHAYINEDVNPSQQRHLRQRHGDADETDFLVDDTVLLDPEQHILVIDGDETPAISIQWSFSIVYSNTFQVPVLYFHVQDHSGAPCTRSQVIRWLRQNMTASADEEFDVNSWDFVSQEQHPHTGFPSYFLHPCRTSERMKLLQQSAPSTQDNPARINFLFVWMSMILPTVNHPVPPRAYRLIQERLQQERTIISIAAS